jgi:serine/threonine protein kinase
MEISSKQLPLFGENNGIINTNSTVKSLKSFYISHIHDKECYKCGILTHNFKLFNTYYNISNMNDISKRIDNMSNDEFKTAFYDLYNILSQIEYCKKNPERMSSTNGTHSFSVENCDEDNFSSMDSEKLYTKIKNYRLEKILGTGSSCIVHLGSDDENKLYAIKKIPKFFHSSGKHRNFKNEIAILKKMDHINIIKMYDTVYNKDTDEMFIILEYMKYGQISKINDDFTCKSYPRNIVVKFAKQIINGLIYLHKKNIVHNDIKPENILLDDDNRIVLTDFGSSEIMSSKIIQDKLSGTYAFFSPEKFLIGTHMDGEPIDIWAFGVTIFGLLYGRLPFIGKDYKTIKHNILHEKPIYPQDISVIDNMFFSEIFNKDPYERITIQNIKKHDFFSKIITENKKITNIDHSL